MARMPSWRGQQCHRDDSKHAFALMMMKTPLQKRQQCHLEDGNNSISTREAAPLQIKGNDAIITRAKMPA
jgi:hypothetical protein